VSLAFLEDSADVIVTYRRQEEFGSLKAAAGNIANGSSLEGHQVDMTDEGAVRGLTERIVAGRGRVDVLVNAIGGYAGGAPLWETDSKVLDQMLSLNVRAGYILCRAVVPLMLKQRSGAIVNVSARLAVDHAAGAAAYAASKAAAVAMIDSLAADLKGTGVRANSILPSIIDTDANRKAMPNADFNRWPKPADIARTILFLSSDDAQLIHGAAVPVYGNG
jgi:NAD(P)-dependent dehydrogenase (short-subunit alcohol dehydrogenase family)